MSGDTPYTRTFRRAIETLGGVEELAQAIDVSASEIEAWAAGFAHPPASAFLKAIDVVAHFSWAPNRSAKS